MSIVAMKKKSLHSKNLSHGKKFSVHGAQSVLSSKSVLDTQKRWRLYGIKDSDLSQEAKDLGIDFGSLRKIYNNWVQPISGNKEANADNNAQSTHIENKALQATNYNCNYMNNEKEQYKECGSNKCDVTFHKDLNGSSEMYTKYKNKKKLNGIYCGNIGMNKPFPFAVSGAKLTYLNRRPRAVLQAYDAVGYYK